MVCETAIDTSPRIIAWAAINLSLAIFHCKVAPDWKYCYPESQGGAQI